MVTDNVVQPVHKLTYFLNYITTIVFLLFLNSGNKSVSVRLVHWYHPKGLFLVLVLVPCKHGTCIWFFEGSLDGK